MPCELLIDAGPHAMQCSVIQVILASSPWTRGIGTRWTPLAEARRGAFVSPAQEWTGSTRK